MAREGAAGVPVRLQSSIAVSAGPGRGWVLLNASPDIRQQIGATPALQPGIGDPLRSTPIKAVILTNADVDHIAGLLSLREREPFHLYGSRRVLDTLDANPIFRVLDRQLVRFIELPLGERTAIEGPGGPTGITLETFAVPGKVALFLETGDAASDFNANSGDTIGVAITTDQGSAKAVYIPGCAAADSDVLARAEGSDALFFDGTVFTDTEMPDAGVGSKTGQRMGHIEISGPEGSMARFANTRAGRRIYIHINNTNPILDAHSAARQTVTDAGWEVAFDGMEIRL